MVLLLKHWTQAISVPPTRTQKHKRSPAQPVNVIPHLQEMNEIEEEQQMAKNRPVVKNKLNWRHDKLVVIAFL